MSDNKEPRAMFPHAMGWTTVGCLIGLGVIASIGWAEPDKGKGAAAATLPAPKPELKPEEVVRIVVEALAKNDADDSGIKATWNFASPSNREVTGPLERFVPMVKNPLYQPMLNSKSAEYGEVAVEGDRAEQLVTLTDAAGEKAYYVFQLSRQGDGKYKDCWMTDGVVRVKPADEGKPKRKPKGGEFPA